jgi:hypothetical protein
LKENFSVGDKKMVKDYINSPRIAIHDNGNQIKYDYNNEVEWVFSPRYGWNEMPEKVIAELSKYKISWNFYGKYYSPLVDQREKDKGYQNNFFMFRVCKNSFEWTFRLNGNELYDSNRGC